jgi:hypothetical protein
MVSWRPYGLANLGGGVGGELVAEVGEGVVEGVSAEAAEERPHAGDLGLQQVALGRGDAEVGLHEGCGLVVGRAAAVPQVVLELTKRQPPPSRKLASAASLASVGPGLGPVADQQGGGTRDQRVAGELRHPDSAAPH